MSIRTVWSLTALFAWINYENIIISMIYRRNLRNKIKCFWKTSCLYHEFILKNILIFMILCRIINALRPLWDGLRRGTQTRSEHLNTWPSSLGLSRSRSNYFGSRLVDYLADAYLPLFFSSQKHASGQHVSEFVSLKLLFLFHLIVITWRGVGRRNEFKLLAFIRLK